MSIAAVVTAAGYGTRLGSAEPKALVLVDQRPLLAWALERISTVVDHVIVTAPPTHVKAIEDVTRDQLDGSGDVHWRVVAGRESRQSSVAVAVDALFDGAWPEPDVILVHDAARAFMPTSVMSAVIAAIRGGADAAVPVIPLVDTIVTAPAANGVLGEPLDRDSVRAVQTPQGFTGACLRRAHFRASQAGHAGATDDATLARRAGYAVVAVDGDPLGAKITEPRDLAWAEHLAARAAQPKPHPRKGDS